MSLDPSMLAIILAAAFATYMTRSGGHLVVSRLKNLPPRVDAALNAVPAAVLTTLVAPAFYAGGAEVKIAMALGLVMGLRFSLIPMLLTGWGAAVLLRHFI
ncbi:AzlD family protein [Allorhizobium sp. BGMRC 0089]|uniref:AzlD family protein n=1 Tax=Allorhizobium sonneratiae TaxID=2934936 RepID=UPI0020332BA9|nr:AzlD family protein [Allorhizobium sonneratiae]MCM2294242.1 AzlD family protein [Allorhizobium sonneratiae]